MFLLIRPLGLWARVIALVAAGVAGLVISRATNVPITDGYLKFVRSEARALRANDHAPASREEWKRRSETVRRGLSQSWGAFPADPAPLQPEVLDTLDRDGYRVEKLVFQTFPGVLMTANAYVPKLGGKRPAILAVHGHWKGAKQDPVVQARCIGAAKLGFFVLAVDAFGAGERGVGTALGEYHGAMTAATLLPVGLPLSGLQVYENLRAVDYLRTRPEVDPERIGITGASGGGNQTMYAGAWDDRLRCVVPVCSVGNYQAYLGAGCCLCELVPGALRFAEEADILGLVAPRGLLVVNATRDVSQFSVEEAQKTLARVAPIYGLFDRPAAWRHTPFESGHDYSQPMREAMYGWMTLHLQGQGDGSPIAEPAFATEDPETLRCFPGGTRPDDWVTIPRFAAARARALLAARPDPTDAAAWPATRDALRSTLAETVLGGLPMSPASAPQIEPTADKSVTEITFAPEPGLTLTARVEAKAATDPLVILLDLDTGAKAAESPLADAIRNLGRGLVTLDLRATGTLTWPSDKIGAVPDHNSAEWGMWIGRPLLGQWVQDVRRLIDVLDRREVTVIGQGPAGLVALAVAAVDPRITQVTTVGSLASFVADEPYQRQRLGTLAPGILRDLGDVAHLAALIAPRRLVVAGGVDAAGRPLAGDSLRSAYRPASAVWTLLGAEDNLNLLTTTDLVPLIAAQR